MRGFLNRSVVSLAVLLSAVSSFALVTIKDSTTTWHTNSYSVGGDYGLISAQANTSVAKTFNCKVIDNEYLKIIVVPDMGGRIVSMVYKPTNHEQLYTVPCGVPYGMGQGSFYYDWLMVYAGIVPTFSEPEHGKFWIRPWKYQLVKQTADTVTVSMSQKDTVNFSGRPGKFNYGATGIECTFTASIITGKNFIEINVLLNNPAAQSKNYEYWTMTTLAPGSSKSDPRTTAGAEIISAVKNVNIPSSWTAIRAQEQNVNGDVFVFNKLRMWKNWTDMGIAYAWPDATTPLNTFWGVINHDDEEGIIRVCNNDQTIGLKMWSWSYSASVNSNSGTSLPYLELWAGNSQMFFNAANIGANQQKTWTERFVPTVKLTNVTHANENVVCNFTSNKASYSGTTDATATVTAQLFFTSPGKPVTMSLSFDGATQKASVLDSTFTADPLGNVITTAVPLSSLCNSLTKITLRATNAQNAELINVNIPVTITNAGNCALAVKPGLAAGQAAVASQSTFRKIYNISGRYLGAANSLEDIRSMALPKGVYLLSGQYGVTRMLIAGNQR
jgi:hypothetical protein